MALAPVYEVTWEDMQQPFEKFIEKVEEETWAYGVCVLTPPADWKARKGGYDTLDEWIVPKPIRQHVTGTKGLYYSVHVEQKSITLAEYREIANAPENQPPSRFMTGNAEDLERAFWKNLTHSAPLYGADGVGTLFDDSLKEWNVGKLESLLSRTLRKTGFSIPGVTTPYLYFGMWRSLFAWHTEDVDLYSVNYLHFGAPKSWYVIPPSHRNRFEILAHGLMPQMHRLCPEFLRHKETILSPQLLQQHSIPLIRAVQRPGQFVINFPGVYHAGFNHGFNCAESTNFATRRWVDVGVRARPCACARDSVTIDMDLFADCSFLSHSLHDVPSLEPLDTPPASGGRKRKAKADATEEISKEEKKKRRRKKTSEAEEEKESREQQGGEKKEKARQKEEVGDGKGWKSDVDGPMIEKKEKLSSQARKAVKKPLLLQRKSKSKRKTRYKGGPIVTAMPPGVNAGLAVMRVRHVERERRSCGLKAEALIHCCLVTPNQNGAHRPKVVEATPQDLDEMIKDKRHDEVVTPETAAAPSEPKPKPSLSKKAAKPTPSSINEIFVATLQGSKGSARIVARKSRKLNSTSMECLQFPASRLESYIAPVAARVEQLRERATAVAAALRDPLSEPSTLVGGAAIHWEDGTGECSSLRNEDGQCQTETSKGGKSFSESILEKVAGSLTRVPGTEAIEGNVVAKDGKEGNQATTSPPLCLASGMSISSSVTTPDTRPPVRRSLRLRGGKT